MVAVPIFLILGRLVDFIADRIAAAAAVVWWQGFYLGAAVGFGAAVTILFFLSWLQRK